MNFPDVTLSLTHQFPIVSDEDKQFLSRPELEKELVYIYTGRMNSKKDYIFKLLPGKYFASFHTRERYDGVIRYFLEKTEYFDAIINFGFEYKFDQNSGDANHLLFTKECKVKSPYFVGGKPFYIACNAINIEKKKVTQITFIKKKEILNFWTSILQSIPGLFILYPIYGGFLGYDVAFDVSIENPK